MSGMRQTVAITALNLQSIPQRIGTSLVICVGIAGVVAVLTTVLAMATGLQSTLASAGREDRAIVLGSGSRAEAFSSVSRDNLAAIEAAPGIERGADGKLAVSPELLLAVNLPRKSDGNPSALSIRGLTLDFTNVRPEIQITAGRMFATGVQEIIVGKAAHDQFARLEIGDTASFHNGEWKIVGRFTSNGDVHESEALGDAATLMSAAQRTMFSAVTVRLESKNAFEPFEEALKRDPKLKVDVQREADYYEGQSKSAAALLEIVATTVSGIMAVGALFGALNTMYSAVSTRTVEVATLRAIGFGALPVVVSVMVEAQVLAFIGAVAGGAIAWVLFNGNAFTGGGVFGVVVVRLHVGLPLVVAGMTWAAVVGLLGGLFPAIRAARSSIVDSLRAV